VVAKNVICNDDDFWSWLSNASPFPENFLWDQGKLNQDKKYILGWWSYKSKQEGLKMVAKVNTSYYHQKNLLGGVNPLASETGKNGKDCLIFIF